MSRRNAREYALKVLYSRELNPETETIDSGELELTEKDRAFEDALVRAAAEHKEIDEKISAHLTNWSLSQLNVVDILYTAYASRNHEDTMRRLTKTHIYKPGDPEVLTQP